MHYQPSTFEKPLLEQENLLQFDVHLRPIFDETISLDYPQLASRQVWAGQLFPVLRIVQSSINQQEYIISSSLNTMLSFADSPGTQGMRSCLQDRCTNFYFGVDITVKQPPKYIEFLSDNISSQCRTFYFTIFFEST